MKRIIYLVCIHLLCSTAAQASNLRQISSHEGISNNAILSLAQDKHGFIWVGSCDGLNMWDGERMRLFPNDWGEYTPLSGNLIEEIAVTTDSLFWIRTNYGLDLFDPDSKHVEPHTCFQGMYRVVTRSSDEVIVITQDNKFSYYDRTRHEFAPTRPMQQGRYADILEMVLDDEGNLWSFSRKGIFCMPVKIPADGQGDIRFGETQQIALPSLPEFAFREGNRVYFIDRNKVFYEFDIKSRQIIYIKDMREELAAMGGKAAVEAAKNKGWDKITAIGIMGVQGDSTSEARIAGFKQGIAEAGGEYLSAETQYADSVADKAVTCMEAIIQAHPEGVSIIVANNDDMAAGAARAAAAFPAYKNTIFVGVGGNLAGNDAILAGQETMTVAVDGYDVGYLGVQAAVDALNGKKLDEFIATDATVVTADNAAERRAEVEKRLGTS